jgi:phosphoglycolate phosphatase-like HAD superfamily hydrolase
VLFASGEALAIERFTQVFEITPNKTVEIMEMLAEKLENDDSGIKLVRLDNAYQLTTKAEYSEYIKKAFDIKRRTPLSNAALERAIVEKPSSISLKKALAWSIAVNKAITALPEESVRPFPLACEALEFAHIRADVAIVSSANLDAVLAEWKKHGLLEHTDIVMAQNSGSKASCISALLKNGYKRENVLMCGDAPGDLAAAEKNGVFFFPILVRRERESWQEFIDVAFDKLVSGSYGDGYGQGKVEEFLDNLK